MYEYRYQYIQYIYSYIPYVPVPGYVTGVWTVEYSVQKPDTDPQTLETHTDTSTLIVLIRVSPVQ